MPTIALVDDDRNILTSVSIALEASMPDVQGTALQTAKPSAVRSQRLCLHPP